MATGDDELRAAAECVRHPRPLAITNGMVCLADAARESLARDLIVDAWLTERDETPVDAVWLRPLCERVSDLDFFWYIDEECGVSIVRWSGGFHLRYGSETISEQATRGQVRTLCRLLGIPLKETPK